MKVLQEKPLDSGVQKLMECLSEFPGKTVGEVVKKTSMLQIKFLSAIAELENDTDKDFITNLENGATIGYETDLRNFP